MSNVLGWIGATLLALCALPEVITAYYTGQCDLSWGLLLMWYFGEWFSFLYVLTKSVEVDLAALLFNYGINVALLTILIVVKLGNVGL